MLFTGTANCPKGPKGPEGIPSEDALGRFLWKSSPYVAFFPSLTFTLFLGNFLTVYKRFLKNQNEKY